jgi:hypothetical protein
MVDDDSFRVHLQLFYSMWILHLWVPNCGSALQYCCCHTSVNSLFHSFLTQFVPSVSSSIRVLYILLMLSTVPSFRPLLLVPPFSLLVASASRGRHGRRRAFLVRDEEGPHAGCGHGVLARPPEVEDPAVGQGPLADPRAAPRHRCAPREHAQAVRLWTFRVFFE